MKPLDAATQYTRRGWSVIPVPYRSKNPGYTGWEQTRLTEADLPHCFNGQPQNIGLLLGEPSGWVIDVDLDHPLCVNLADGYLPPTDSVFGRPGKRRSHRLYNATGPMATKKYRSKVAGMLVELRSTGLQTVIPPGTHESGEAIEWESDGEPAVVDPQALLDAVTTLANAVRGELGETIPAITPKKVPVKQSGPQQVTSPANATSSNRISACIGAMVAMKMVDHRDGSSRLYAAACRVVEHDLNDTDGVFAIREFARQRPFPADWTDAQILDRIRDAEKGCERGVALQGIVPLGQRDPVTGRLVLSPTRTLPTAEAFILDHFQHPEGRTLYNYAGLLMGWRANRFVELECDGVRQQLQPWLHNALRYVFNKQTRSLELVEFESNPASVNAALESVRAYAHLAAHITPPHWLKEEASLPDPLELLPCRNGNLHVPSATLLPCTPTLFNINALDFDYDPNPEPPEGWIRFLEQLWGDDLESVSLLQEWMGYCLVGDTSQQKMLMVVGPKRSGKGTIGRVLRRLVGVGNVAGPTTSSLAGPFGLQPLMGKSLAIVSDARFSGENIATVVERLLCISGEDTLTIDRKFLGSVTMKLLTRFMFLTNELPRINDASGALAGRFLFLRLTRSFYGHENTTLTAELMQELPGILLWAIDGLKRLRQRGHFVQPQSVADAVREMEDLASPVMAFVRDCCDVGVGQRTWIDEMYAAWKRWCDSDGRTLVTNRQTFGRDLAAAVPGVLCRRHSVQGRFYDGIALRNGGAV